MIPLRNFPSPLTNISGDSTPGGADSALLLVDGTSGLLLTDGASFLLLTA